MEAYHVVTTHPSGMPMFGSCYTKIDCWDDGESHVSRLATPAVVPDAWVESEVTAQMGLQMFCKTYGLREPPPDRGKTVADARAFAAEVQREKIEADSGIDHSKRSRAYMLDMVQWKMFPNFFPWWGEGMAWWYTFTPLGSNPNECIMEVRLTKPIPKGAPRPEKAPCIEIDFDKKGVDYFLEAGIVGVILDEDMENLVELQDGFKAAPEGTAAVLSKYHEARIRHFQEVYAQKLGL